MEKLNFFGVGPKIGRIVLPWLLISIFLSIMFPSAFEYINGGNRILTVAGIVVLLLGFVMYFATVPLLLRGLKETRLVTKGAFRLCCNPLYAAIILLILPGISLLMNTWLMLSVSLLGYIVFKLKIKAEYDEMEKFFGEEYLEYRRRTSEFFPWLSGKS
jgi:protein-S-isoprenylcysteine O-methyltransferase Ste14